MFLGFDCTLESSELFWKTQMHSPHPGATKHPGLFERFLSRAVAWILSGSIWCAARVERYPSLLFQFKHRILANSFLTLMMWCHLSSEILQCSQGKAQQNLRQEEVKILPLPLLSMPAGGCTNLFSLQLLAHVMSSRITNELESGRCGWGRGLLICKLGRLVAPYMDSASYQSPKAPGFSNLKHKVETRQHKVGTLRPPPCCPPWAPGPVSLRAKPQLVGLSGFWEHIDYEYCPFQAS